MHFDWSTLVLQTINILVLLWLLRRFLFRPVVAIIAERKDAAEKLLADADAARDQVAAAAAEAALREKTLAASSEHILADAHAAAEAERAKLLDQTAQEAARAQEAALASLEQDRIQMRRELEGEARTLAVTIASRLVSRMPSQALDAALLQSLDAWLGMLPSEKLRALAPANHALEVVTAARLDGQTQAACREMLIRYLGGTATLQFGVDPSLIVGVELRGSHGTLRNNWRADLDHIAQELSRDDEQRAMA
jgi:F-type H+-transporting ATPase subunit b